MSWEDIREINKYDFVEIGNHSHSHDYLIDFTEVDIKDDLKNQLVSLKINLERIRFFSLIHLVNTVLL